MLDIITFGSATRDIFLQSKTFKIVGEKKFITGKGLYLSLGSKIEIKNIYFSTGGGGTNTAATFANQRFRTAYCGIVGNDPAGEEVIRDLKRHKIESQFVLKTRKKPTNLSVVLTSDGQERTILVYRGASEELAKKAIPWSKLKAKWFYLAPLSGKLCRLFEFLVDFAQKNKIKIMVNPGNSQLALPKRVLERILKKIDILALNQEEASLLTNISYFQEEKIFKKIDEICPGIAIMTKGPAGVVVSDGQYLYQAVPPKSKVVDRTGAGDAFNSGFLSGFIQSQGHIPYAIQLGIANSSACLQEIGAKNGLLKKNQKWPKVKVKIKKL
ncbi:MAG: carbohydrate kinase family protein [Minisyncoccales bacterium]